MNKVSSFEVYQATPFSTPDISKVSQISKSKSMTMVSEVTGEVLQYTQTGTHYTSFKDTSPYLKIYRTGLGLVSDLTKTGIQMLCFVMAQLRPGYDTVEITRERVKASGYKSLNGIGYYRGLFDLLSHGVIARAGGSTFYVNPNVVFNGDRTRAYREQLKNFNNEGSKG